MPKSRPTVLPLNPTQIPRLLQEARALEAAGQLDAALQRYRDILGLDPESAAALYQAARIEFRRGHFEAAYAGLDKAVRARPNEPAIWTLAAKTLQKIGDPDRAAGLLAAARQLRMPPGMLAALEADLRGPGDAQGAGLGTAPAGKVRTAAAALKSGDLARAERLARALRKDHPDVAPVADLLANTLARAGKPDEAEPHFRAAAALDPAFAETRANFGRFLISRGRLDEAAAELNAAVRLAPRLAPAWSTLGRLQAMNGRDPAAAETAFRQALAADPAHREALMELGRLLMTLRRNAEAIETLHAAMRAGADEIDARLCLSRALAADGDEAGALDQIDRVLRRDPGCGPALAARAGLHQTHGRFAKAREDYLAALDRMPRATELYRMLLIGEKLAADDPLIARMQALFDDPGLTDAARAELGFALAKAMEDSGRHDRVFTYLRPANRLLHQAAPYDMDRRKRFIRQVQAACAGFDLPEAPAAGGFAPIFVTGLPRSGTTLVEQILASHSQVTGGGELGLAWAALHDTLRREDGSLRPWTEVSGADLANVAAQVEQAMRARHPGADRITDKGVRSYTLIGPILAAFPAARMVVVNRDPRDTLLSIYRNRFEPGQHLYGNDLATLGRYYRLYEEIMAFWRETLPGRFHEIAYEDLIAAPEAETRRLVQACGLDWEDACLDFHRNRRQVHTLSVHQVRQPIYQGSVGAWKRYEAELGELFQALKGG